ncbi:hypothetical protein R5R35_006326 [Gryllus longicercus]|uniref:Uncharacterized protein n=1 Tax=Gryllus longicercus TaxID=2509291 RepID=A0AAN9Z3Y8_9ORTH
MFPDSHIAQAMAFKSSKMAYIITYGLWPFFRCQLLDDTSLDCPFSVAFDESPNKVSQKSQMDLVIRHWSRSKDEVVSMYLDSTFLGYTKAADLLEGFKSVLKAVDLSK